MTDIPSKDEFAELARDYASRVEASKTWLASGNCVEDDDRQRCARIMERDRRLALACTIAGNVVDAERFEELLVACLSKDVADFKTVINAAMKNRGALIEALTKGGGDG